MAILTTADQHTAPPAIVGTLPPDNSLDGTSDGLIRRPAYRAQLRTVRITHANAPSAASRAAGALIALRATDPDLNKAA